MASASSTCAAVITDRIARAMRRRIRRKTPSSPRFRSGPCRPPVDRHGPSVPAAKWPRRRPLARPEPAPWSVMVADVGARSATIPVIAAVTSGRAPVDRILQNPGGLGLRWAADDTLVFMSYRDGFPHLYALQHPGSGGT